MHSISSIIYAQSHICCVMLSKQLQFMQTSKKKWEYFDRCVREFKIILICVYNLLSDLRSRSSLIKAVTCIQSCTVLVLEAACICCLCGTSSLPLRKLHSSCGTIGGGEGNKSKEELLDYSLF